MYGVREPKKKHSWAPRIYRQRLSKLYKHFQKILGMAEKGQPGVVFIRLNR